MKTRLLLLGAVWFGCILDTNAQTVLNNNFQDVNIGGTGVTITYFPSGADGKTPGDVTLYEDVVNIGGTAVDLYIVTTAVNNGYMSYFDNPATSGPSMTNNEERFFSPQFNFSSGGGYGSFDLQFIEDGTFSYNSGSGAVTATNLVLTNVSINTYDIDGNGSANSEQFNEFGGFYSSELGASTTLNGSYSTSSGLSRFESLTTTQVSNVLWDDTRVRVNYDSISDFSIVVGAGASGYAYFYLDFGPGANWSSSPVEYFNITGSVFDDGNGLVNSTVDGVMFDDPSGTQLYATLVGSNSNTYKTIEVLDDGNFLFSVVEDDDYTVVLTTSLSTIGAPGPTPDIPATWVFTGEFLGYGSGSDGNPDGILSLTVNGASIDFVHLGIDECPDADPYSFSITTPIFGSYLTYGQSGSGTSILTGDDYEDGAKGAGDIIGITSLPTNGNDLYYNGTQILTGQDGMNPPSASNPFIITNYNPILLAVRFVGVGSSSTTIQYVTYDSAGVVDPTPADYILDWGTPLPVKFAFIEANVATDLNIEVTWATELETNNKFFEVQRLLPSEAHFTTIGQVPAVGNSTELQAYKYLDASVPRDANEVHYRIKQVDHNDGLSYSDITSVSFESNLLVSLFPNPAGDNLTVALSDVREHGELEIFDMQGSLIFTSTIKGQASLDISEFANGLYLVYLHSRSGTDMQRIHVKQD